VSQLFQERAVTTEENKKEIGSLPLECAEKKLLQSTNLAPNTVDAK
jgi:hypothetical protein